MRIIPFYSHTLWVISTLSSCFIYKQWFKNSNLYTEVLHHELTEGCGRHIPRFLFMGWVRVASAIRLQISYRCHVSTLGSYHEVWNGEEKEAFDVKAMVEGTDWAGGRSSRDEGVVGWKMVAERWSRGQKQSLKRWCIDGL